MTTYFKIVKPNVTCSGPKAGVGYIRCKVRKLEVREKKGILGTDFSVDIVGFGLWILNEHEFDIIDEKEYFVDSLKGTFKRFKAYK